MNEPVDSKPPQHRSFVPEGVVMKEFTLRAVLLGLVMTVVLGAANAYLGLRAGMTIAATYPAAVIGMAVLRLWKGTVLEENLARTAGSIGESVAAGAIFTVPAFLIAGSLDILRSVAGVLEIDGLDVGRRCPRGFVRVVGTAESGGGSGTFRFLNPWPHRRFIRPAGAAQSQRATYFGISDWRCVIQALGELKLYAVDKDFFFRIGNLGKSFVRLGPLGSRNVLQTGAVSMASAPTVSPAYLGVGYVIGPELASLQFSGA